ncbi:MAG: glycosyltransferase family 2 protein [bacterium]|nr:glycosyltransferase family 2 protein [bacterium]
MATTPYFIISPNTILSLIGLVKGPDKTVPTPAEDWREAKVAVVIPALNEQKNIVHCLASLARQTRVPDSITLIDDGSSDNTINYAREFCRVNEIEVNIIKRKKAIGKTPTLKRQSRETDADVQFILDGDTVLESRNYIARTVEELYKGVGIASACGTILPLREKDRKGILETPEAEKFLQHRPHAQIEYKKHWFHRLMKAITNIYRESLYMFLQRFIYHGQMVFFGSITNPVGCAVAYRRKYVKEMFDQYEPEFGDNLTNSEDIFIGFAMVNKGYRNIQLNDITARSCEPYAYRLPRQIYMWSSSFLQSCFYFNSLLKSPLKSFKRYKEEHRKTEEEQREIEEKRKIKEAYRQPFGEGFTKRAGRPMGWVTFTAAFEKIAFPTTMLIMLLLQLWEPLIVTIAAESALSLGILLFISRRKDEVRAYRSWLRGVEYFFKGLLLIPIRYLSLMYDLVTIGVFATHVWSGERRWRK